MPIYEYKCDACHHVVERFQRAGDPQPTECPRCAMPALHKVISATSFRLKGGGWYETDFKTRNRRRVAGESETPAAAASA